MSELPNPAWEPLGETSNADFYAMRDDVLIVLPHVDTLDTAETARESLEFQVRHWRVRGHRGAVVVWMDRVLEQGAGAREVYATETHGLPTTCYALVGETFFAQATSAVFEGLTKPGVPTRVFESLQEAIPWMEEMNRERGGPI